jgi:NitT/TauT family transport system ATP-binding protein
MAQALEDGSINAFCVGEPWGSVAVENGVGALLLPGNSIWSFAPEKVLAVRTDWAETEPELLTRMIRAVWQGARWAARPESRTAAAEMLSRPEYLGVPAEVIDRALTGRFIISNRGEQRETDGHVEFFDGAANFPWRSQAQWIGSRLARRFDLDQKESQSTAAGVFRSDLFRAALQNTGADIPGASQKLEGAIRHPTAVASLKGELILQPDTFFDECIFEPLDEN